MTVYTITYIILFIYEAEVRSTLPRDSVFQTNQLKSMNWFNQIKNNRLYCECKPGQAAGFSSLSFLVTKSLKIDSFKKKKKKISNFVSELMSKSKMPPSCTVKSVILIHTPPAPLFKTHLCHSCLFPYREPIEEEATILRRNFPLDIQLFWETQTRSTN